MSAEVFSEAMGLIGEKYIMEAATYQRKKHTASKVWLSRVAGVILAILLAGSAVLDAKIPMIVERNFVPGGKISINHKDIKNVVNTAHALDVPIPYSAQLYEILQTLKIHGHMNDDHGGIVQYFEALADVKVEKHGK